MDVKRAKLSDLVDNVLKGQLGYSGDFSIKRENDLLYDVDEDVHLDKRFEELSLKADTFITVFDEADEDPKVDVVFSVVEQETADDTNAIVLPEELKIAKRPKASPQPTNGVSGTNGNASEPNGLANGTANGATKRKATDADIDEDIIRKRGKVMEEPEKKDDDLVVLDDSNEGAIVIDDD